MKCPKCQTENKNEAKFCNECGTKLEVACPECGNLNRPGSKFCDACGHDLREPKDAHTIDYAEPESYTPKFLADKILTTRSSIVGERKLVTVLFADVSDFTSISEKLDPEEVHQMMDGCFKILLDEIHRHEGTINQFTGDGVMALFGAPVAYEDHARRACQSALNIQKAMRRFGQTINQTYHMEFKLRVGLNSGTVVVGAIGDDLRMDYTAVGDTTNLAARMESTAAPGTVLVSKNTFKLARDFFEFESLGNVAIKGKAKPQDVYRLIKPGPIETRVEASLAKGWTKFVGRQKEISTLTGAFDKVRAGSGQVVGTVGEAGVGKSRLLIELSNVISKEEYTYLEGRCLPYGGAMPYLPMRDIVRAFFHIREGDQEAVIKSKLQDKISLLEIKSETIVPPLQEFLSLTVDDEKYLQLDPGVKKVRMFEAIRDLLIRESQNKPVIVAVDDLHWIDHSSEEFLSYLIEWLANTHILLILLYRPEYTHQWGNKSVYSQVGLVQLTRQTSAELVQAILEGGLMVPQLNELIYNRAGGNPLFVEELTHNLLENGTIEKKDRQYDLARDTSDILVPDNIQGIIAACLDRVEESLKIILQVASVIGREFAFRLLQTILGMREELKSQMLNLQGLEFISEKSLFPELEYIFKHALTQEVAYNSLLQNRRKEIHARIGNAIEAIYPDRLEEYYELLAHHYERSDDQNKALEYLDFANQKAAKVSAMEEAKIYFDKAMQLLDSQPESSLNQEQRISMIVNQMIVFELLLNIPEYYDLLIRYKPMAQKSGNQGNLGAFYSRIAECEWWFGDYHKAIENANKAIDLAQASGRIEDAAFAYTPLQFCYFFIGEFEKVVALKDQVLRLTDQQFNLRWYVWGLSAASLACACLGR
jgi:class 3 adenylate cyclase